MDKIEQALKGKRIDLVDLSEGRVWAEPICTVLLLSLPSYAGWEYYKIRQIC